MGAEKTHSSSGNLVRCGHGLCDGGGHLERSPGGIALPVFLHSVVAIRAFDGGPHPEGWDVTGLNDNGGPPKACKLLPPQTKVSAEDHQNLVAVGCGVDELL